MINLYILCSFIFIGINARKFELYDSVSIIERVNSANTTWKAGHNFDQAIPLSFIKKLLGTQLAKKDLEKAPVKYNIDIEDSKVPEEFDARKHWPYCPSIKHIRDQGDCGSCWAISAASVFSDRLCIATKGKFKKPLSANELLACCSDCGFGCKGGKPIEAWAYFKNNGIVTGGDYRSHVGCQPYQIPPCEHFTNGTRPPCHVPHQQKTPECKRTCINKGYKLNKYIADHRRTKSVYWLSESPIDIQKEIMKNGPVQSFFLVFADFPSYKSGVYKYTTGKFLAGHGIKIIGWGKENGTPYWLVANSWNTNWGDKGLFKILRGENECGIESMILAGEPDV